MSLRGARASDPHGGSPRGLRGVGLTPLRAFTDFGFRGAVRVFSVSLERSDNMKWSCSTLLRVTLLSSERTDPLLSRDALHRVVGMCLAPFSTGCALHRCRRGVPCTVFDPLSSRGALVSRAPEPRAAWGIAAAADALRALSIGCKVRSAALPSSGRVSAFSVSC